MAFYEDPYDPTLDRERPWTIPRPGITPTFRTAKWNEWMARQPEQEDSWVAAANKVERSLSDLLEKQAWEEQGITHGLIPDAELRQGSPRSWTDLITGVVAPAIQAIREGRFPKPDESLLSVLGLLPTGGMTKTAGGIKAVNKFAPQLRYTKEGKLIPRLQDLERTSGKPAIKLQNELAEAGEKGLAESGFPRGLVGPQYQPTEAEKLAIQHGIRPDSRGTWVIPAKEETTSSIAKIISQLNDNTPSALEIIRPITQTSSLNPLFQMLNPRTYLDLANLATEKLGAYTLPRIREAFYRDLPKTFPTGESKLEDFIQTGRNLGAPVVDKLTRWLTEGGTPSLESTVPQPTRQWLRSISTEKPTSPGRLVGSQNQQQFERVQNLLEDYPKLQFIAGGTSGLAPWQRTAARAFRRFEPDLTAWLGTAIGATAAPYYAHWSELDKGVWDLIKLFADVVAPSGGRPQSLREGTPAYRIPGGGWTVTPPAEVQQRERLRKLMGSE